MIERIGELSAQQVGAWRASLPEKRRYPAHRALRQVLEAALRWKWIEENPAALVKNPAPKLGEIDPFESWAEIDAIVPELNLRRRRARRVPGRHRACGRRRRSAPSGATSTSSGRVVTVRRAFAKGRLKDYAQDGALAAARAAARARRRGARAAASSRRGILFPNAGGRAHRHQQLPAPRIGRRRWRRPASQHRRIYDLRHTYATWSLAAGVDIFTLARRMGTSVAMIDRTYGHLAAGADDYERELLDAFDGALLRRMGAIWALRTTRLRRGERKSA